MIYKSLLVMFLVLESSLGPNFFVQKLANVEESHGEGSDEDEEANAVVKVEDVDDRVDPGSSDELDYVDPSDVDGGKDENSKNR